MAASSEYDIDFEGLEKLPVLQILLRAVQF